MGAGVTRSLPAWAALPSYLVVALLIGVAIGIVIAPMPSPVLIAYCPAPVIG